MSTEFLRLAVMAKSRGKRQNVEIESVHSAKDITITVKNCTENTELLNSIALFSKI